MKKNKNHCTHYTNKLYCNECHKYKKICFLHNIPKSRCKICKFLDSIFI
jgi:hypothetical protein